MSIEHLFQTTIKPEDQRILDYALVKAFNHSSGGKTKLYAVATDKRGVILAEAGNYYGTEHEVQGRYRTISNKFLSDKLLRPVDTRHIGIHAEALLLERLKRVPKEKREGVKLYVSRAKNGCNPGNAKPCIICRTAIDRLKDRLNIKQVFYTN